MRAITADPADAILAGIEAGSGGSTPGRGQRMRMLVMVLVVLTSAVGWAGISRFAFAATGGPAPTAAATQGTQAGGYDPSTRPRQSRCTIGKDTTVRAVAAHEGLPVAAAGSPELAQEARAP